MSGAGVGGFQASGWVVLSLASEQGLLRYLESFLPTPHALCAALFFPGIAWPAPCTFLLRGIVFS